MFIRQLPRLIWNGRYEKMTQRERRNYLIMELLKEQPRYYGIAIPPDEREQKQLLRSLFNIRTAKAVSDEFLKVQDDYLQAETAEKGVTDFTELKPLNHGIYLWRGDITALRCDAIVNAANSGMQGCFFPCHNCVDNQIHTFAGVQLRLACAELIKNQGHGEETGKAKLTPAFNLPCKYVLHTVGPIVKGRLCDRDKKLLYSCYRSCLEAADTHGIKSIAFCCISTGEFHFPNEAAAEIAIKAVKDYKAQTHSKIEVIFNVFKDIDCKIYRELLGAN